MELTVLLLTALAVAAPVHAAGTTPSAYPSDRIIIATSHTTKVEGEVRKVDLLAKKITIKHGELKNLDMPSMTMVFQVKDPAMIDQVKAGDKVRFRADKINGAFTVVEIEVVK